MITVVPKELDLFIGLTPALAPKIAEVMNVLIKSLAEHDTILQPKESLTSA